VTRTAGPGKLTKMIVKGTSLSIKVVFIRSIGNQKIPVAMTIINAEGPEGLVLGHLTERREVVIAEIEMSAPHLARIIPPLVVLFPQPAV